jgi:hypothetical protein
MRIPLWTHNRELRTQVAELTQQLEESLKSVREKHQYLQLLAGGISKICNVSESFASITGDLDGFIKQQPEWKDILRKQSDGLQELTQGVNDLKNRALKYYKYADT